MSGVTPNITVEEAERLLVREYAMTCYEWACESRTRKEGCEDFIERYALRHGERFADLVRDEYRRVTPTSYYWYEELTSAEIRAIETLVFE